MEVRRLLVEGAVDRWDPMSELLLHSAARREHVVATIRPALDAGSWVVSDRFADSTMAYQGYGHGLGRDVVQSVTDLVTDNMKPDITIILDLPVTAGLARAAARGQGVESSEDRYERMDPAFHERLREGFRDIARREPERCVIIDAALDAETVAASVWHTVATRLNLR